MALKQLLIEIDSYLPFLYSLVFIVSIGVCRRVNSLTIIAAFLAILEFISSAVTLPLLNVLNEREIERVVAFSAWSLFWTLVALFTVVMLQQIHVWLNIEKKRELKTVQGFNVFLIILYLVDYTNSIFIKSDWLAYFYSIAVPTTFISIASYLLFELAKHARFAYVHRDNGNSISTHK